MFISIISIFIPVKTNNHGYLTYWGKKKLIDRLKSNHGYRVGYNDSVNGVDDNFFIDSIKWDGYERAQYDNDKMIQWVKRNSI